MRRAGTIVRGIPGFPELTWAFRFVVRGLRYVVETSCLGITETGSIVQRARGLRDVFSRTLRCPRGHEVPAYGVYDCICGAAVEGWVFRPCAVCGESAGWTPCPECGLPVRSPLRG